MAWFVSPMRFSVGVAAALVPCSALAVPYMETTVFDRGEAGYDYFRIPAIVQAQDGAILAFAEGRRDSGSDFGNIDLVLKRSLDGGQTWGPIQVIANNGTQEAGNPAPVVDQSTGNVVVVFTKDRSTPWVTNSTNNGQSWSVPTDITAQAKAPEWNGLSIGPNHAIQLERGPNAGRLVVPSNHTLLGQPFEPNGRGISLIYSDDGGVNWDYGGRLGNATAGIGPNESVVTELVNGDLYVNARSQGGFSRHRLVGYSQDGGLTFTGPAVFDLELVDPQVQGSVIRYSAVDKGDARNRLLFSNPKTQDTRSHLHVRSSFDETSTWTEGKLINRSFAAYSDLVALDGGNVGVLYEWGNPARYDEIRFTSFTEAWLDDPTVVQLNFDEQSSGSVPSTPGYLADSRGYGLNASASGDLSFVAGDPRYGNGAAIRFSGGTEAVRVADVGETPLDFEAEDSFTLEAVFRTTAHSGASANDSGPIVGKDFAPNQPSYWMRVQDSKVRFLISDTATASTVLSDVTVNDGEWHHVAAVRDAEAGMLSLYIDYIFAGSVVDETTGDLGNIQDLIIGGFNESAGTTNKQFNGDIDFIRVSAGALGTDAFIQALLLSGDYNASGSVEQADLDLVLNNWGIDATGNPPAGWINTNGLSGVVDQAELDAVLNNWGASSAPDFSGSTVPEPALGLVALAAMFAGRRRV